MVCHLHTHKTQQFLQRSGFCLGQPGEPVPKETFTQSHLSRSSIIRYLLLHLLRSMASSLFNLRACQSFAQSLSRLHLVCLLVSHPPLHTPYIFSPNHCLLFAAYVHTIATCFVVVTRLYHLILVSFSTLTWSSIFKFNATHPSDHSHLCPLKCHLIFFSYRPISLPCNVLLRTQLLYHLPFTINDISVLVSYGTNCPNFFHPFLILASTSFLSVYYVM